MSEKKKLRPIRMYNVITYVYTSDNDKVETKKTSKQLRREKKK